MSFLDKLWGRDAPGVVAPDPSARTMVVPVERPFVNVAALKDAGRQMAEWVMTPSNGLGILTGCGIDGKAEVTLIKENGNTKMMLDANDQPIPMVISAGLPSLRRAYLDEVPAARHPDVDHESHMRSLGFIHSSEAVK